MIVSSFKTLSWFLAILCKKAVVLVLVFVKHKQPFVKQQWLFERFLSAKVVLIQYQITTPEKIEMKPKHGQYLCTF